MTHDPRFGLRFQGHPGFLNAAVIYDFIPLEWPGYLPTPTSRIGYIAKMARLSKFDLFLPISEYAGWRLSELLAIPVSRIHVTGASVRRSLYDIRDRLEQKPPPQNLERFFLTFAAADVRKNVETAVQAVRKLNRISAEPIRLKIAGHDYDHFKGEFLKLAGHGESEGFLEFCPDISDEGLVSLFRRALAAIIPSHIEGFSLPVVEASVCGCPAIASTCAAHLELIDDAEALFRSGDADALADRLSALLSRPGLRAELVDKQCQLATKFHENAVGERFWGAIESSIGSYRGAPNIARRRKPRLAFLSPFPPDQSGVARYTAMTMEAGRDLFDSYLYSDAPRPLTFEGAYTDAGPVSVAPLLSGGYDAVISVLGNSPYHARIFDVFEGHGGPCILHDARLTQFYSHRLGHADFLKYAAKLLGRAVSVAELGAWLQDRDMPTLFLEPIIERASPLIVNTVTQRKQIKQRYGIDAKVTTSCPTVLFSKDELRNASRLAARKRYGIPSNAFLVSTFGYVAPVKGIETCVLALEVLRSWDIPAELYFIGNAGPGGAGLNHMATQYGIG